MRIRQLTVGRLHLRYEPGVLGEILERVQVNGRRYRVVLRLFGLLICWRNH